MRGEVAKICQDSNWSTSSSTGGRFRKGSSKIPSISGLGVLYSVILMCPDVYLHFTVVSSIMNSVLMVQLKSWESKCTTPMPIRKNGG